MKKTLATIIYAGFLIGLVAGPGTAAPAKDIIPKGVKRAMEAGLADRLPTKTDIPFTISENIVMPGPERVVYVYLVLKAKNADMGYALPTVAAAADPSATGAAKLQAKSHVFVRLYKVENGKPGPLVQENDMPAAFTSDPNGYDPEAVDWYSFGYPLYPGDYLAAVALASDDLVRSGIQYYEFTLPDPAGFTDRLETSTVLIMKSFQRVENPETPPVLHRGILAWSVSQITPNLTETIKVGAPLDFFFYIYGARPDEAGKFDLQLAFRVDKLSSESEIDAAKYPLLLKNWAWERTPEGGSIEVNGEVKNISKENLNNIEALVNFYDKDNKYLTHSSALIEVNPIGSSQTSPFKVVQKDNPLIENAVVEFKYANGDGINKASLVESAIRFEKQPFQSPLISLPLPLKQTFEIRTGDKVEFKKQDLAAGRYVLVVTILDKASGLKGEKKLEFVVE